MSKSSANINNNDYSHNNKLSGDIINWEVVKNHEYKEDDLSKVVNLYIIKVRKEKDNEFLMIDKNSFDTLLVKINITKENVFLNRILVIEIMKGIFSIKFHSKKKSSVSRLQDLHKYINTTFDLDLPIEMEESLIKEYKEAVKLFKNSSKNF